MMSINYISISNISGADYRRIINGITRIHAVNIPKKSYLTEERGVLEK